MDIAIDKLITLLQKTILNSQVTVHLFFPFLFSLFSVAGIDKPKIDFQKNADKIYSVINFLIYNIKKKNILGYFELLNSIPHLNDIIGPISIDQKNEIVMIEKKESINKYKVIAQYQEVINKIFLVVEKYLNINKNTPWILKSPLFYKKLKIILISENNDKHEYFIEKYEINKYFQISIFNNVKKNDFTLLFEKNSESESEISFDDIYETLKKEDYKTPFNSPNFENKEKKQISKLIHMLFNEGDGDGDGNGDGNGEGKDDRRDEEENKGENGEKNDENKIINIFLHIFKKYTFNYNTKIYFLGHSIYGCLSFYLLLNPLFLTWICEKNIKNTNIHIINIGTPPFMDENTANSILENNYNIYHLLSMKDINIFQKNEKWIHNGIPLILGNPDKIDKFYNSFFNTYCKNNDLLKKMKIYNTKKYYLEELNNTYQRYLKTKSFLKFEPNEDDNWFSNYPFNTNISLPLPSFD